jgi:hypothetical protein
MSIATMNRDRQAALAVLLMAYKNFGTRSFLVDPKGKHWQPLRDAERYGWCWFQGDRCALTPSGLEQVEGYRRPEPRPVIQHICPVCLDVVSQELGDTGLPDPPYCPSCSKLTRERIEELLTEQQRSDQARLADRRTA